MPEQQAASSVQELPEAVHTHLPFAQIVVQQSVPCVQVPPVAPHAHLPPVHDPAQQSAFATQKTPVVAQAQLPPVHVPEQQDVPVLQVAPLAPQVHWPLVLHAPVQQSLLALHPAPAPTHVQLSCVSQAPEQHDEGPGLGTMPSTAVGLLPGGTQQTPVPPHQSAGSHCGRVVHCIPSDETHTVWLFGSVEASPEQHWLAEVTTAPYPWQVHTPPLHDPETHPAPTVQVPPFAA